MSGTQAQTPYEGINLTDSVGSNDGRHGENGIDFQNEGSAGTTSRVQPKIEVCTGRAVPQSLRDDFPVDWRLDHYWTWTASVDGEIVGVLLGCPCHGVAELVRIRVLPGHGRVIPRLLRTFVRDCIKRDLRGYVIYLGCDDAIQYHLKEIALRAGAKVLPYRIIAVAGKLEDAGRW